MVWYPTPGYDGGMQQAKVGFLHPGAMGVSLAASAIKSGHPAFWVSDGRSEATRARASNQELDDCGSLQSLCNTCDIIVSVCPPHAARDLAESVMGCGFRGIYADVNAISPARSSEIESVVTAAGTGASYVDGGIIGGPAWEEGTTTLHLSGPDAASVAEVFAEGPLGTSVLGDESGRASALKMCYAANTKGGTALLCAIAAAAEKLGVLNELEREWARDDPEFAGQTFSRMRRVTAKAWRFAGEMTEIAETFEGTGLPGGFHRAACEVYERMAAFKGAEEQPSLDEVLAALNRSSGGPQTTS